VFCWVAYSWLGPVRGTWDVCWQVGESEKLMLVRFGLAASLQPSVIDVEWGEGGMIYCLAGWRE